MSKEVYNLFKHEPEVPPPTYDKYNDVLRPKPSANERQYILHGWEKMESGTMRCIDPKYIDKAKGIVKDVIT
jgi:hypothetical protein